MAVQTEVLTRGANNLASWLDENEDDITVAMDNQTEKTNLEESYRRLEDATLKFYKEAFGITGTIEECDKKLTELLSLKDIGSFSNSEAKEIFAEWEQLRVGLPTTLVQDINNEIQNALAWDGGRAQDLEKLLPNFIHKSTKFTRYNLRGSNKNYNNRAYTLTMIKEILTIYYVAFKQAGVQVLENNMLLLLKKLYKDNKLTFETLRKKPFLKTLFPKQDQNIFLNKSYRRALENNIFVDINVGTDSETNYLLNRAEEQNIRFATIGIEAGFTESTSEEEMVRVFAFERLLQRNPDLDRGRLERAFSIFSQYDITIGTTKLSFIGDIGEIGVIYSLLGVFSDLTPDKQEKLALYGMESKTTAGIDIILRMSNEYKGIQVKNYDPEKIMPRFFRSFNFNNSNIDNRLVNGAAKKAVNAAVNIIAAYKFNKNYMPKSYRHKIVQRQRQKRAKKEVTKTYFVNKFNPVFDPIRKSINFTYYTQLAEEFLQRYIPETMSIQTINNFLQDYESASIFIVAGKVISSARIIGQLIREVKAQASTLKSAPRRRSGDVVINSSHVPTIAKYLSQRLSNKNGWPNFSYLARNQSVVLQGSFDFSELFPKDLTQF